MSFIRSRAALLFVNVYQIIQHLNTLSDGRHQTLFDAFTRLKQEISPLMEYVPGSGYRSGDAGSVRNRQNPCGSRRRQDGESGRYCG
jgi:hypothetical protein